MTWFLKRVPFLVVLVASCMLLLNLLQPVSAFAHTATGGMTADDKPLTNFQRAQIGDDIGVLQDEAIALIHQAPNACAGFSESSDPSEPQYYLCGLAQQHTDVANKLGLALCVDGLNAVVLNKQTNTVTCVKDPLAHTYSVGLTPQPSDSVELIKKARKTLKDFIEKENALANYQKSFPTFACTGFANIPKVGPIVSPLTTPACNAVTDHFNDIPNNDKGIEQDLKTILLNVAD